MPPARYFVMPPSPTTYGQAWGDYVKSRGYRTVGILYGDDAFGGPEAAAAKTMLTAAGIKVVEEAFTDGALDLTPQLVKLQIQHPDALIISAYRSDAGYALQDAQTLGLTLPMIGDIATSDSSVLSTPPPAGMLGTHGEKNFKYQVFASTVKTTSTNSALNTMFAEIQKQGALPTNISAADSYDGIMLAAAVATKAGTISDPAKIADAVLDLQDRTSR